MGAYQAKPEPPQISINALDADVPIIPPIVLLALLVLSLLLAKTVDRFRIVPDPLSPLKVRAALFALLFGGYLHVHLAAMDELHAAGSGIAFTPTAGVAKTGPYTYTRNPFYCGLIFCVMPALALLFDCGWLVFAIAPMFAWLSKFVIPGEEAFLSRSFGVEYETYLASTPRWLL